MAVRCFDNNQGGSKKLVLTARLIPPLSRYLLPSRSPHVAAWPCGEIARNGSLDVNAFFISRLNLVVGHDRAVPDLLGSIHDPLNPDVCIEQDYRRASQSSGGTTGAMISPVILPLPAMSGCGCLFSWVVTLQVPEKSPPVWYWPAALVVESVARSGRFPG